MCEKNDTNYLNQILHFTVYRYCTSCMGGGGQGGGQGQFYSIGYIFVFHTGHKWETTVKCWGTSSLAF